MSRRLKRSNARAVNEERNYSNYNNYHGNKDRDKDNVVNIQHYRKPQKKLTLLPKNLAQETYIDALEDSNTDIVFAIGSAGTGKTMLGTLAAINKLQKGEINKIIITRPAISVDEQHGFLPGTLVDKMQPWVLPILDYFYQYYSKKEVLNLIEHNVLEISPLAYMRGRTFPEAFIIADEFQNSTANQMKMLLTRIGYNSKIVVTGDLTQHDRGYNENGLLDFINRLSQNPHSKMALIKFSDKDIERHPIIEDILKLYNL